MMWIIKMWIIKQGSKKQDGTKIATFQEQRKEHHHHHNPTSNNKVIAFIREQNKIWKTSQGNLKQDLITKSSFQGNNNNQQEKTLPLQQ